MSEQQKIEIRVMGEYSIAKSFKGILRIAHIIDTIEGDPDVFLNQTYYGTPKTRIDLSGGLSTTQKGVPTAEHSLKGGDVIKRYNSPDKLKNKRVPMTDSMGNYLNWNVGVEGVTIGSNEALNNNSLQYDIFRQASHAAPSYTIGQEKFFPVYETGQLLIGKINKKHRDDNKSNINEGILNIQSGLTDGKLIIENLYDKSHHTVSTYYSNITGNPEPVQVKNYSHATSKTNEKGKPKLLRTIYNHTKQNVQDYDVIMYRQDDFDYDNYYAKSSNPQITKNYSISNYPDSSEYNNKKITSYKQGDLIDCNVDTTNIKKYILSALEKFSNGNIIEVPSGAVIWQYCSLDKWRSIGDDGTGSEFFFDGSSPGHRPIMQIRNESRGGNGNASFPFYSSTIQGACKKYNKLLNNGNVTQIEDVQGQSMTSQDETGFLEEIIPLYKRDYVLCDGTKYRIPFYPEDLPNNMEANKQHYSRFINLFFNIGYKYTPRQKMYPRPKIKTQIQNGKTKFYVVNSQDKIILTQKEIDAKTNKKNYVAIEKSKSTISNINQLSDVPAIGWGGEGAPDFSNVVSSDTYKNCPDIQILFGEDMATMISCNILYSYYSEFYKQKQRLPKYEDFYNDLVKVSNGTPQKRGKFPEKFIFNSFIGHSEGILLPFSSEITNSSSNVSTSKTYKINIGKEVNHLSSEILFYDTRNKRVVKTTVWELPMVQLFLRILLYGDSNIIHYLLNWCYSFYNYDFCVPKFLPDDDTPAFIGTGAYLESDKQRVKLKKVIQWNSKYSHSTIPHRHAVFAGKSVLDNLNVATDSIDYVYRGGELGSENTPNIATFYGGNHHPFNRYNKKGNGSASKPKWIEDQPRNYIINQHHMILQNVIIDDMPIRTLINKGFNHNVAGFDYTKAGNNESLNGGLENGQSRRYGWATGRFRKFAKYKGLSENGKQQIWNYYDTTTIDGRAITGYEQYNLDNISSGDALNYYIQQSNAPYSLLPFEDPRFDTSEPNRGMTSQPVPNSVQIKINYNKITANQDYGTSENANGSCGFFSPEHITMLPLIKL